MLLNTSSPAARSIGLILFLLLTAVYLLRTRNEQDYNQLDQGSVTNSTRILSTVAKISVVSGDASDSSAGPIASHKRHALRHGYPMLIYRSPSEIGPWNEALYLLSVLIQELEKPPVDRIEWLMFFDAASVVINPEIPLETFLPPSEFDDVHFLATKHQHVLDTATFFLRIHPWSVRVMSKVLGSPLLKPVADTDYDAYQTTMVSVLNETEHRSNVLYQPRTWYNAYQLEDRFEGKQGDLSVRFTGEENEKRSQLETWGITLDGKEGAKWQLPLPKTSYPEQTSEYWETLRTGKDTLALAQAYLKEEDKLAWDDLLAVAVEKLEVAINKDADRDGAVKKAAERVNARLKETKGNAYGQARAGGRRYGLGHHSPTTTHLHEYGASWRYLQKQNEHEMRYSMKQGGAQRNHESEQEDEDEVYDSPPQGSGGHGGLKVQDDAVPGQRKVYGRTLKDSSSHVNVMPGQRKTYGG